MFKISKSSQKRELSLHSPTSSHDAVQNFIACFNSSYSLIHHHFFVKIFCHGLAKNGIRLGVR